jgi:23S rRNA (uracil1939-C5)-methyltransferase
MPPEIKVVASPPLGYRNRAQFHRISGKRLGFKAKGRDTLVELRDCPVLDDTIRSALREGRLLPPPDKDRFNVYGRDGLLLSEGGTERGVTRLAGMDITVDAGVFFQGNGIMLEALIAELLDIACGTAAPRAADLYCGVGTFAAFLEQAFPGITLVEENRAALDLARVNVRTKGAVFFAGTCDAWLKARRGKAANYAFVLADPPRQGLSPAVVSFLTTERPPLFAYVSCDAASLARDSARLCAGGFALRSLTLYDFYPQTTHVESLAVFAGTQ